MAGNAHLPMSSLPVPQFPLIHPEDPAPTQTWADPMPPGLLWTQQIEEFSPQFTSAGPEP